MSFIISVIFYALVTLLIIGTGLLIYMDLHKDYKTIKGTKKYTGNNKLRVVK